MPYATFLPLHLNIAKKWASFGRTKNCLVLIRKFAIVILSPSASSGQAPRRISDKRENQEILRRFTPQNDNPEGEFLDQHSLSNEGETWLVALSK